MKWPWSFREIEKEIERKQQEAASRRYHVTYYSDGRTGVYVIEAFQRGWKEPCIASIGGVVQSPSRQLLLQILRQSGKRVIEDADEWDRFVYGAYPYRRTL